MKATVAASANYQGGEATKTFTIAKADIAESQFTKPQGVEKLTYTGAAQQLVTAGSVPTGATIKFYSEYVPNYYDGFNLNCLANTYTYTADIPTGTNAGYYAVLYKVDGGKNYEDVEPGQTVIVFVDSVDVKDATIEAIADTAFTGEAIEPELTVTFGQIPMVLGTDYTVAYTDNVSAGKATATITGKGNYKGTKSVNFNIVRKAITDEMVTLSPESFTYDGTPQTPTVTVAYKIDEQTTKTLTENTDYTISYQKVVGGTPETVTSPTDAGEYNVVVTGKGNYSGTASATLTIIAADIAKATIAAIENKTFTGDSIKPNLSVTLGNYTLIANKDYTVAYTDNVSAGTATATITGQGNFTGTNSAKFTIVNRTLDITKLTFHEGWTTFYSLDEELDLPAGYGAYVASGIGDGVVSLTQIKNIPAEVPVLLNNATTTTTDNMEYSSDNLLQYAGQDIVVNDIYYYGLHNGTFMRVTGTIPAGKIYLYSRVPEAPRLTIVFDNGADITGISDATRLNDKVEMVNSSFYDLQGRKVIYPKKGLYIKNGRKVVVNNK